jgi:hypothetical protein
MLQGLDPVLEGIVGDLNKVTDFSNMIELGKKSVAVEDLPLALPLAVESDESAESLISNIKK